MAAGGTGSAGRLTGSVLRENTLARIRGPAIRPAAAPAMIQGSVTVPPCLGLAVPLCDGRSLVLPAAQPA